MKSKDIKFSKQFCFNIKSETDLNENETYDYQIASGILTLFINDEFHQVDISERKPEDVVEELIEFKGRSLLRVDKKNGTNYAVTLLEFYQHMNFDETFEILIDDAIYSELRKRHIDMNNPAKFFAEEIIYNGKYWFGLGNDRLNSQQRLFGKKISIVIEPSSQNYLHIVEIRDNRKNESVENLITLMSGKIEFKDRTADIHKVSQVFMEKYREATCDNAELIELWRIYDELNQEAIRKDVAEMGFLKYKSYRRNAGNLIFDVDGGYVSSDFLRSDMQYVAIPKNAFNEDQPFDFNFRIETVLGSEYDKKCVNTKQFVISEDTMDAFRKIPENGYIRPSISGSIIQSKRRKIARQRILNGESPMIGLNVLLQSGEIVGVDRKERPAISDQLRKSSFNGDKTKDFNDRQKEAIRVAINTPDIAVIQGPPGTGKTKVIKAIIERINELEGETAKILVTSTQHDAVDNAVDGVSYNGVPVNRVVTKQKSTTGDTPLYKWIDEMIDSCDKWLSHNESGSRYQEINQSLVKLKNIVPSEAKEELSNLYQFLQKEAFSADILATTNKAIVQMIEYTPISNGNSSRLEELLSEQKMEEKVFLDDSGEAIASLMMYLKYDCDEIEYEIPSYWKKLRRATTADDTFTDLFAKFIADIKELKAQCKTTSAEINIANESEELQSLIELVETELIKRDDNSSPLEKLGRAVWEFKHELTNTTNVKNLISKYSQVNAATCQQSANPRITETMKGFDEKYDYVIIDEAARSNPLDLLIPMSMGKKVILVGDHKQLPHMVERDIVEDVIEQTKDENVKQVLEESLFMRLFNKVREYDDKAKNDIKNPLKISRTCTLNEQFRMHSEICNLINVFYKEEQLRPACKIDKVKEFDLKKAHNLGLYNNNPLAWIDVPITENTPKEYGGISKSRKCEIDIVKRELNRIVNINSEYSIGIITFYSKQAQLISEMIDDDFNSVPNSIEVGTVDAFQGKEFDVVILSTVRANAEDDMKKRVGFLNNNNRLCVAFSRAQRLLITIGDSKTVAKDGENIFVQPLCELFERSKRKDIGYYESI